MKTSRSPHLLLSFLFLLPGPACSADDDEAGEGGEGSPDAAVETSPPDAAEPPEPDAAPSGAFTLEGDVVGAEIPPNAELIVAWQVTANNPDHAYKYGDGSSTRPR